MSKFNDKDQEEIQHLMFKKNIKEKYVPESKIKPYYKNDFYLDE